MIKLFSKVYDIDPVTRALLDEVARSFAEKNPNDESKHVVVITDGEPPVDHVAYLGPPSELKLVRDLLSEQNPIAREALMSKVFDPSVVLRVNARKKMVTLVEYCRDGLTDEVNHTALAELVAGELSIYEGDNYDIPEWLFEMAGEYE